MKSRRKVLAAVLAAAQWTVAMAASAQLPRANQPDKTLTPEVRTEVVGTFSYNMKNLKRATLVGETTGGGAHPGGMERLNDHFGVFLPVGRAINPITKTNWEGTGVSPDVACTADEALKTAHIAAMKKVLATVSDPDRKANIESVLQSTQKELDAMKTGKRS